MRSPHKENPSLTKLSLNQFSGCAKIFHTNRGRLLPLYAFLLFRIFNNYLFIMMVPKQSQTMRYTANFTCPSGDMLINPSGEQMMYESNRSRSDSGTSGSSGSSRGSGKPPRRRSHRPRGCRGGSSRRRNNSADNANGKQPVKSSDPSTNKKVLTDNNKQESSTEKSSSTNDMDPFRQQNHYPIPEEFSFPSPQPKPPNLSRSYQDCHSQHGEESISLSAATAPSTDYSSNVGSSYDQYSSFYDQSHMSTEFPALLRSFSDSSSESAAMEQQKQLHSYNNILPPCAHITNTNGNNDNGYILPPLPSNAFENERIPSGRNPYALRLSTHPEGYYSQHSQPPLSHQHGYGYPTMTNPHFQQQASALQMPYSNHHNQQQQQQQQQHPPYDYHAERLEKQRQNVEGGSLFCTSPRSFLMGRKTEA